MGKLRSVWLRWREAAAQYGPRRASVYTFRLLVARRATRLANRLLPARVECPCCGWKGHRFHDYLEPGYVLPGVICPSCESHPRHRALYLWLKVSSDVLDRAGVALMFAPERSLADLWSTASRLQRIKVDIDIARDVDLVADIRALPFADGSVDLVWCHHVLEHVEDDRAAIRSLAAVLKRGVGELIVSVPTVRGARTREFGAPDPLQTGHWRVYGDDFIDRLRECGLLAREIGFKFSKRQVEMHVLFDEPVFQCVRA